MPESWNEQEIQVDELHWTAAAGAAAQTVEFEVACGSFGDGQAINQTGLGAAVALTDSMTAVNAVHIIDGTASNITVSGAGAGELMFCRIQRDIMNDNLSADAELLALKFTYTLEAANDG